MLGIFWQWKWPAAISTLWIAGGFCLVLFVFLNTGDLPVRFRYRKIGGLLLHILLLCAGMLCCRQSDIRHSEKWLGHHVTDSTQTYIHIDEPPQERKGRYKISAAVIGLCSGGQCKQAAGRVLIYLKRDSLIPPPAWGESWLIRKPLQPIRHSGNPGAFNYAQYAAFRNIYHRVLIDTADRIVVGRQHPRLLSRLLHASRNRILQVLKKNLGDTGSHYGIAAALLIGHTDELDQEVLDSYVHTGVVHIIAVSGMHLGLIYLLLNRIFSLIPLLRNRRLVNTGLRIAGLWLFALLTGASASVCRAAVMFTFVDLGRLSGKTASGYNALAASAFILLLHHPFHLWDIGFQLSYLAVGGIMLFQQPFYGLMPLQNRVLDEVWKLSAVSIAAQLLTFPICLFYFHQFPLLFLPANLLAVPLSSLAIYAGIALVACAQIPFVAGMLAWLVHTLIRLMNGWIAWVDRSPLSVWEQVPATSATTILLYALIFLGAGGLMLRRAIALKAAAGIFFLLVITYKYDGWRREKRQGLWVFHIGGESAVWFIQGNRYRHRGDEKPLQDEAMNRFHVNPALAALALTDTLPPLSKPLQGFPLYAFCGKKILFIEKSWQFEKPLEKIPVDLVVLSHNARLSIRQLDSVFAVRQYVADGSNALWKTDQWENECEDLHLHFHATQQAGAFYYDAE